MSAFPPSAFDSEDNQGAAWQRPASQPSAFSDGGRTRGAEPSRHAGQYSAPGANPYPAYGEGTPAQYGPSGAQYAQYDDQHQNAYPSPYIRQMPQMYPRSTNTLAIIALVTSILGWFFISPILGWIALKQIKQTGDGGAGFAKAGIVISALWVVACVGYILLWVVAGLALSGN